MANYDFIPASGNPRNSEGAFLPIGKSRLMFAYTSFTGEAARDYTSANISIVYSDDDGATWSKPETVVRASDCRAMNVMSVSLLRMLNGDIGLFYLIRKSWYDMQIVLQRSSDEGKTWGGPVCCSTRNGYFVINNDRAFIADRSRIIMPAAEHKNHADENGKPVIAPAITTFFMSDDDGRTWFETETPLKLDYAACRSGLQEPGVAALENGSLYGWARTDLGRQYEFYSHDGGLHWTAPAPSRFTSPLSPMSVKRLGNGQLIAIWNPVPLDNITKENKATGNRTPLVYALSNDGKQWQAPVVIENDPNCGYCYTAILEWKGALLLAYCAGSAADRGSCLNRLRIRRLTLDQQTEQCSDACHPLGIGMAAQTKA